MAREFITEILAQTSVAHKKSTGASLGKLLSEGQDVCVYYDSVAYDCTVKTYTSSDGESWGYIGNFAIPRSAYAGTEMDTGEPFCIDFYWNTTYTVATYTDEGTHLLEIVVIDIRPLSGVYFDDTHSYDDLNLIPTKLEVPPAKPKTNYINIPGGDGSVDLTEAHGEVKYYDRECRFTFTMNPDGDLSEEAWEAKKMEVSNFLNGQKFKITLDKDAEFYYLGRCEVNEYLSNKRLRQIVIVATVEPYKLKQEETVVTMSITENCPSINIDESNPMTFEDFYDLEPGRYIVWYPFTCEIDDNTSMTLDEKSILIVEYGASSQDRIYTCGCIQYTYDWYNRLLVSVEEVDPDTTVELVNLRKTVCPTIISVYPNAFVKFGDTTYRLAAGSNKIADIQLQPGTNTIKVVGYYVMFRYQEGAL